VSDDFDRLKALRPDRVEADDPVEPTVFAREKERLMSTIDASHQDAAAALQAPDIYPRLAYEDERAALDFLTRVFQLAEIREARTETDESMLAWLRVGNGVVMIGHANAEIHRIHSPRTIGNTTVQMMVYVHDIDAHYAHAVAEGADITMPIEDAFYGVRRYEATDLEGHRWHFGERLADIKARGGVAPAE
jgi:PhnB protein